MNSNLILYDLDNLKVGDTVGIIYEITYSWRRVYRHRLVEKCVIERITPKRTKFVLSGNIELSDKEMKTRCVVYNSEAIKENSLAIKFLKCKDNKNKLENSKDKYGYNLFDLSKLDDEDLDKVNNLLTYFCNKYIGGSNENS